MPLKEAGFLMFVFSVVAMISKLTSGFLADIFDRHKVFTGCFAVMLLGVIALATMNRELLFPAAIVIAMGWGGLFTLLQHARSQQFRAARDRPHQWHGEPARVIGAGLGSWVTGILFDVYGSYQVAFIALSVMVAIALVLSTQIRSEVDERSLLKV